MNFKRKLPIPMEIKEQFPLTAKMAEQKDKNDIEIKNVFTGKSDKLLLVILLTHNIYFLLFKHSISYNYS